MEILKSAVIQPFTLEKTAEMELPKDPAEWKKSIFNYFYESVPYLPKEAGADIVISNADDKKGYAKGSLVIFNGTKQINFPIIVKDFKLSPMDVFVMKNDSNEYCYMNATEQNIRRAIGSDELAMVKNMNESVVDSGDIKSPGGITPKNAVSLDPYFNDYLMRETSAYGIAKRSSMLGLVEPADLQKLASDIKDLAGVRWNFEQGIGDITKNIVNLADEKEKQTTNTHVISKIKPSDVIDAKQAMTVMDSEIFDPSSLPPVDAPCACEIRIREFPCAEAFMNGGQSAISRMQETMAGKSVAGIVMPYKERYDIDKDKYSGHIFFSNTGQYYCEKSWKYDDKEHVKPLFYGASIKDPKLMQKIIENIAAANINSLNMFRRDGTSDKAEKQFAPQAESIPGRGGRYEQNQIGDRSNGIFIIIGNGGAWEAIEACGDFRKYSVNNRNVYVSSDVAFIPTNVIGIQKVSKVHNPVYRSILGHASSIYLIPEMSVIISKRYMESINGEMVLGQDPDKQSNDRCCPVSPSSGNDFPKNASITKIAAVVGDNGCGYNISGKPMDAVCALTGIEKNAILELHEATNAMRLMGTTKERAFEILKTAILRTGEARGPVTVYGLRDDFVSENPHARLEKIARMENIMKQMASEIRVNMLKEASLLADPEAVDVVLSLNFINDKNLFDYIESLPHIKRTLSKLCSMLVASRMGLTSIDETATRASIDGLQKVVEGLETVKLSIGK